MAQDNPPAMDIIGDLQTLGITSLCQWDVMVFLQRHRDSLLGADHLARLLGYETEFIVVAMEELEALGLLRRSRVSQGARFYQFIPPLGTQNHMALERLLALASNRPGRLHLSRELRRGRPTFNQSLQPARPYISESRGARRRAQPGAPFRNKQGENTWLKAI